MKTPVRRDETYYGTPLLAVVIACILLLLAFAAVVLKYPNSPEARSKSASDSLFSAERAFRHVTQTCQAPHSVGTANHAAVRDYIVEQLKELRITTRIDSSISRRDFGLLVQAGTVHNIVATIPGKGKNKSSILVVAHYDTPPNSPGASDDGAGVAALLEIARLLRSSAPLENDVVFLFSDCEEAGLLGAHAFSNSLEIKNANLVINLEARGSSGESIMFETIADNGGMIDEYAKASSRPIANSLSFEIYKRLPNDTDYSIFKQMGIPGFNHAFISNYVNYHSMNDRPENLSFGSLQHHGENATDIIKHFGKIPLDKLKSDGVVYFNVLAAFVHYPKVVDSVLLCGALILVCMYVFRAFSRRLLSVKEFLISIVGWLLIAILQFYIFQLILNLINWVYPTYENFNAGAYNVGAYLFLFSAVSVLATVNFWHAVARLISVQSIKTGFLAVAIIALLILYFSVPTAAYVILYPFIAATGVALISTYVTNKNLMILFEVISAMISFVFLLPVITTLYTAFGLGGNLPFVVVVLTILLGFLIPFIITLHRKSTAIVSYMSLITIVASGVLGHLNSNYSEKQPLITAFRYILDADENRGYWTTGHVDAGNESFFYNAEQNPKLGIANNAPIVNLQPTEFVVLNDSSDANDRYLRIHCKNRRAGSSLFIAFTGEIRPRAVNIVGTESKKTDGEFVYALNYFACPPNGIDMEIVLPKGSLDLVVEELTVGLDTLPFYRTLAAAVVHGPGYNSNTISVRKTFHL